MAKIQPETQALHNNVMRAYDVDYIGTADTSIWDTLAEQTTRTAE